MEIIGIDHDGSSVFRTVLRHGEPPTVAALRCGSRMIRPVQAVRGTAEITLTLLVESAGGQAPPPPLVPHRDMDLRLRAGEAPRIVQRIAAYAVATSDRGLLATEYSNHVVAVGRYGLPGGGIDPEEQPVDAVLREVGEETAQEVEVDQLVAVHSGHWIGRSPRGDVEDFHAVRLIYTATCAAPSDPQVIDVGGTTESACWVALDRWDSIGWTTGWKDVIRPVLADFSDPQTTTAP